ncbi:MAG TPA: F0F1 ATP synthase subunit gamma [Patescibacteria group bacterium]|nr:F0F1 ATP synthase subunit gamma [Patescibacteria group bacterium]
MQAYKQITDEINLNQQFKMLTQAYQEHAIVQINLARFSVLASREFMGELAEIFYNVKKSYELYLKSLTGKEKDQHKERIKKNGKEVLVLLSANGKFYGDLVTKVSRLFVQQVKDNPDADVIIVGSEGRIFFENADTGRPFTYLTIPDTSITLDMLKPLIQAIIGYQRSLIFYGKFNNIIVQDAVEGSITGDMPTDTKIKIQENEDFLFEPNIEFVMEFFENQIFSMLLNQTVSEGKLARFASRIKAMEAAQNNLLKQLGILNRKSRRIRSMESNKKQLQLFAGRALWNKK